MADVWEKAPQSAEAAEWEKAPDDGWEKPSVKPSLLESALDEVAATALAGIELGTSLPGIAVGIPQAIYGMATGKDTPEQALGGIMESGKASAEAALTPFSQEHLQQLRERPGYRAPMEAIGQVFQGVGNIAGGARYLGGKLLGEDEVQAGEAASQLGAGAQIGGLAVAPFLRGTKPPTLQANVLKAHEGLAIKSPIKPLKEPTVPSKKATSLPTVDFTEVTDKALGRTPESKASDTAKAVPYETPDTPATAILEESTSASIRRFHERGGEAVVGDITTAEATRKAIQDFREGRDPFAGPGKKQAGAVDFTFNQRRMEQTRDVDLRQSTYRGYRISKYEKTNIRDEASYYADVFGLDGTFDRTFQSNTQHGLAKRIQEFIDLETSPTSPFKGPGKKQRGTISLGFGKKIPKKQTQFEAEENIPGGAGAAMFDLKAPLINRWNETVTRGEDLNIKEGTPHRFRLPNDVGIFFSKFGLSREHATKLYAVSNPLFKAVADRTIWLDKFWDGVKEDFLVGPDLKMAVGENVRGVTATRFIQRVNNGFKSITQRMDVNDRKALVDARLKFDGSDLIPPGEMWPSRELLAQHGYNEAVINAYLKKTEVWSNIADIIDYGRGLGGKPPITRIPGHFPHTYKGHVGIKVFLKTAEGLRPVWYGKTSGTKRTVERFKARALNELKTAFDEAGRPDAEFEIKETLTDRPGSLADVMDALETVSEMYANTDKPLLQLVKRVLDRRIVSMEQAFLATTLKRAGTPGWIGKSGVTEKNLRELERIEENYISKAIEYTKSQEILAMQKQLPSEVWAEMQERMPNLFTTLNKILDVSRSRIPLSEIDKPLLDIYTMASRDTASYRAPIFGLRKVRSLYAIKDLAWSASYHSMNFIQPEFYGVPTLLRERLRIGKGNPIHALAMGWVEFLRPSLETKEALKWAAKKKVTAATLMQEADIAYGESGSYPVEVGKTFVTGKRPSELNEMAGRTRTFIQGLLFYRSTGVTEMQARSMAAKYTDDVMVNYGKIGQPLWLSHNPAGQIAGQLLSPYATFQFNHWGHIALILQAIKNNPTRAEVYLPALGIHATTTLFAGIRGLTGFAELAALWTAANIGYEKITNKKSPYPDLRALLVEMGVNDPLLFGVPSTVASADIGATAIAPEVWGTASSRQLTGFKGIYDNVFPVIGKIIMNEQMSDSEKLLALKEITPNWIKGMLEVAYAPSERVTPDFSNRRRGTITETYRDRVARMFTGKRSLKQERERMRNRVIQTEEMQASERKSDLTELALDYMEEHGDLNPDHVAKAFEEGYKPREFRQRIFDLMKERERTRIESKIQSKRRTRTRDRIRERVENLSPYDY